MKLKRHQSDSVKWELKHHGLNLKSFPNYIPCARPTPTSRIAQTTCMFRKGNEFLLYFDEHGPFLNQRIFSPYECVFIDDLPQSRPRVLGSINMHMPLKNIAAFLITADIVRTYLDVESIMILEQIHSKLIKVHGYYIYCKPERKMVPFGFTITTDNLSHISVCRHSNSAT